MSDGYFVDPARAGRPRSAAGGLLSCSRSAAALRLVCATDSSPTSPSTWPAPRNRSDTRERRIDESKATRTARRSTRQTMCSSRLTEVSWHTLCLPIRSFWGTQPSRIGSDRRVRLSGEEQRARRGPQGRRRRCEGQGRKVAGADDLYREGKAQKDKADASATPRRRRPRPKPAPRLRSLKAPGGRQRVFDTEHGGRAKATIVRLGVR